MDSRLLAYAEQQAPRYTSYPTAPHFSAEIGEREVRDWLGEIGSQTPLSLYIHVPYCQQLCWYCGCNTYAARRDEPIADYVRAVLAEMSQVANALNGKQVREIHWGGGTPNILSPAQFQTIFDRLSTHFDLTGLKRHAIELDPRFIDREKARTYADAGVSRVSLGVQDFNDRVQHAIGRVQPVAQVKRAVRLLHESGIDDINIDLMYGLPHQTVGDLRHSIHVAATMRPNRIALFGYAHVPWFKKRQRLIPEASLPSAAERFDQAEAARGMLQSLGYMAIGIDHYALPSDDLAEAARSGQLRRSFQGYVTQESATIIGLGPSAISTLPRGYVQNLAEPGAWGRHIEEGNLPIARGHALSQDDRTRRRLIEQIMCDFETDLSALGGANACARELRALKPMFEDKLIALNGDHLSLAPAARPLCRVVAKAFDAYAAPTAARHSRAI